MSWRYRYPSKEDFDTTEEWEEACRYYESAADDYADELMDLRC